MNRAAISGEFTGLDGHRSDSSGPLSQRHPNVEDINGPPGWRIHQLTGDRARTWSISVSGNLRITFEVEKEEIINLDLEDYH